jgi:choline dehydrogenase
MLDGVKLIRTLAATPALSRWAKCERDPGPACASDDQIIDFVRNKGFTVYHPVGTCKMGSDAAAVVDQKLRVHGMQNLRVIDASVMPSMPSANTYSATMVIAEKGSDLIRGKAAPAAITLPA